MAPTTHKALGVPEEKADWKLYTDRPVPSPEPTEVLIKIMAVAVNPVDAFIQKFGAPFVKEYPWFGGVDGAGVVEEIGSEVTTLKKGDRVYVISVLSIDTVHSLPQQPLPGWRPEGHVSRIQRVHGRKCCKGQARTTGCEYLFCQC